ncbi:replicase [Garlic common virus]|nr:replicase [Garlic common virus]QED43074.1 replicase [Garlic common virus]QED43079.1 replicase [Garlic common virus]QED43084.1 replicase [Garlic common virus]
MASLVHLTRAETVLSQFSSDDQARIASGAVASFSKQESDFGALFNYSLDSVAKQRLSGRGLYLSPYSFVAHSHPVCKTIENCIIHVKLPNYLDDSFTIIGIKDKKLSTFKKVTGLKLIESFNRYVTSGDITRYSPNKFYMSAREKVDLSKPELYKMKSLSGLVPSQLLKKKVKRFFLYDEIHYWSKLELINFLDIFEPEIVVATHVFPKEILRGAKESMNPWAYQFKILDSKTFSFAPDGEWSESYEQPLAGGDILLCNKIQTYRRSYSVQVVDTIFSHSIVIITKDDLSNPNYRTFSGFDAISVGELNGMGGDLPDLVPVRCQTVLSIFKYLRTLKKPDIESAIAKLRQMVDEPSGYEIRFIEELSDFMLTHKEKFDIIRDTFISRLFSSTMDAAPSILSRLFKNYRCKKLSDFIKNLEPFSFTVKLKTLRVGAFDELESHVSNIFADLYFTDLVPLEISFEKRRELMRKEKYEPCYSALDVHDKVYVVDGDLSYSNCFLHLFFYDLCDYYSLFCVDYLDAVRSMYRDLESYLPHEFVSRLDCIKVRARTYRFLNSRSIKNLRMYVYGYLKAKKRELSSEPKRITWGYYDDEIRLRNSMKDLLSDRRALGKGFATAYLRSWKGNLQEGKKDSHHCFNRDGSINKEYLKHCYEYVAVDQSEYTARLAKEKEEEESRMRTLEKEEAEIAEAKKKDEERRLIDDMIKNISFGDFPTGVLTEEKKLGEEGTKQENSEDDKESVSQDSNASDEAGRLIIQDEDGISSIMHEVLTHKAKPANVKTLTCFETIGDGDCFWHAISCFIGMPALDIKNLTKVRAIEEGIVTEKTKQSFLSQFEPGAYAEEEAVTACIRLNSLKLIVRVDDEGGKQSWLCMEALSLPRDAPIDGYLVLNNSLQHYSSALPREGCVIRAVAEALKSKPEKILNLLMTDSTPDLIHDLTMGFGIQDFQLSEIFKFFDIEAHIFDGKESKVLHTGGSRIFSFVCKDGHIEYAPAMRPTMSVGATIPKQNKTFNQRESFLLMAKKNSDLLHYTPSVLRARKLEDSLLKGTTGLYCSRVLCGQPSWLSKADSLCYESREVNAVLGTFGSGKSTVVIDYIKKNLSGKNMIITPRRKLADQMLSRLGIGPGMKRKGQVNTSVLTFETALRNIKGMNSGSIFIDEIQLYPPGYLDMVLLCTTVNTKVMVMGDPAQSTYDNETDREIFLNVPSDVNVLLDGCTYNYLIKSRRFLNPKFKDYLPCDFDEGSFSEEYKFDFIALNSYDELKKIVDIKSIDAHLVSSFSEKGLVKSHLGRFANALTFGESTGLTYDYVSILLTEDSKMADNKRWLVALSRAKIGVFFVNYSGVSFEEFAQQMNPSFVSSFLYGKPDQQQLRMELPGNPVFVQSLERIGNDEIDREERLKGDPWLKPYIFLGKRPVKVEKNSVRKSDQQECIMKIHCPITSTQVIYARYNELIRAKEIREERVSNLRTEQFTEERSPLGKELTNQAERYEAIYPRHKGNDTATFILGARKRLKFSNIFQEEQKLKAAIPGGSIMIKEFLKRIKIDPRWDPYAFEEARNDFEVKKLEKSAATIENHAGRSNKDWDFRSVLIFMKSQLCTKDGKRFVDAKAGQTLACFHHTVLVRFAPYIRYMEKKLFAALPKNYYIHSGKNFDDLKDWVIKNNFTGVCTESDYEAFDSSQDASILAFELNLMKYMCLPNDVIADYKFIKIHIFSKLGKLAIMRFTGEAATFLFNTMANMVYTFMTYSLNGKESICFAGDDMCANKRLTKQDTFKETLERMSLKAKVQFTKEPTFCGWCLCEYGIIKRPNLVLERMLIAIEKGNLADCLDSYAIEVSYAYSLGERLVSILSKENLDEHYMTVRLIILNEELLRSNVRDIFNRKGRTGSPERLFN